MGEPGRKRGCFSAIDVHINRNVRNGFFRGRSALNRRKLRFAGRIETLSSVRRFRWISGVALRSTALLLGFEYALGGDNGSVVSSELFTRQESKGRLDPRVFLTSGIFGTAPGRRDSTICWSRIFRERKREKFERSETLLRLSDGESEFCQRISERVFVRRRFIPRCSRRRSETRRRR